MDHLPKLGDPTPEMFWSLKHRLATVRRIVDEQADDEGCWFHAQTCAEAYLQAQLRRLHDAIEYADFSAMQVNPKKNAG